MRENLATLIEDFRRYDREVAVVRYRGNRRMVSTYGDIARLAGRFAALLVERGIGRGDRIILWAENGAEWIAAFYGCILRGVLVVPLDAYGSAEFAARIAADVKPKLAVGDALLLRQLRREAPLILPQISFEDWNEILPEGEHGAVADLDADTPLQILFTSGTTGDPKGIVHTHGNVLSSVGPIESAAQKYLRYEKYVHPLRFLHTLPLSHVFGQTMGLWIPHIFRAEVHFESRLVAPRLIETIKRERISVLAAVPRVFALLKTHLEGMRPGLAETVTQSHTLRAWKKWWRFRGVHHAFGFKFWALISGGGALPPAVEQFWNALGFVLVQGYGMTETTALITLNHPFHVARGTIGKPLPGREVKIGPDGEVLVRGPMISTATWSDGQLHERADEWLATGDLAETQATGELRFLGRKSEVIVTSAGVNIHPEDLEAAIEEEPGVAACAVVATETPSGPEPFAVVAMRGSADHLGPAIDAANARLGEFQRVRRWAVWPEPDLPRTSTGKVRRKAVAEWLADRQSAAQGVSPSTGPFAPSSDWLVALIMQITGEAPPGTGDELRLAEDLNIDSLGRVQLSAAIEQKYGVPPESGLLEQVRTLGDLRKLVDANGSHSYGESSQLLSVETLRTGTRTLEKERAEPGEGPQPGTEGSYVPEMPRTLPQAEPPAYIYPTWPWLSPIHWIRLGFLAGVMRPLVWFLASPRVHALHDAGALGTSLQPVLIVANHITSYDGPLIQYALPGHLRRRVAVAMSGEMLEDYRHFRNPVHGLKYGQFFPFGPVAYFLLTALFNVFPLPRSRDFQRSFAHAGVALDRGFNVMIFPEGTRSDSGELARFRPGIGLLVKQSHARVIPVAIRGLGALKKQGRGWFRSGKIEIRIGRSMEFPAEATEAAITDQLHHAVERLLSA